MAGLISASAQDIDAAVILKELHEQALISPEAAQAHWESLSDAERAAVQPLFNDIVTHEDGGGSWTTMTTYSSYDTMADGTVMAVQCSAGVSRHWFSFAGIYGGGVWETVTFCYEPNTYGYITSAGCSASFDVLWPWQFNSYIHYCTLTSGGVGFQHVAYKTQGNYTQAITGAQMFPCAGFTADGFGNTARYICS